MSTRTRLVVSLSTALLGLGLLGLGVAACDQGEGQRCQRDEDCSGTLRCNQGTHLCQAGVEVGSDGGIDAPNDADVIDAPDDAGTDATPDAAIDAAIDAPPAP